MKTIEGVPVEVAGVELQRRRGDRLSAKIKSTERQYKHPEFPPTQQHTHLRLLHVRTSVPLRQNVQQNRNPQHARGGREAGVRPIVQVPGLELLLGDWGLVILGSGGDVGSWGVGVGLGG